MTTEANESVGNVIGHLVIIDRDGMIKATIEDAGDWSSWQRLPGWDGAQALPTTLDDSEDPLGVPPVVR